MSNSDTQEGAIDRDAYVVELQDRLEERACPRCEKQVWVREDTPEVWCPCVVEPLVAMKSANQRKNNSKTTGNTK